MRAEFVAYLRRTEGRLAATAVGTTAAAILVGLLAVLTVHDRQALLDDAVERRGAMITAALDVYRAFADADASSLDAVLVDSPRAAGLRQQHREAVFEAANALREATARDPNGTSAGRVRQLADLVPEYVRLVETGWASSQAKQPVGISYLSQASFLVRDEILPTAKKLHQEQTEALATAQRAAGQPAWLTFAAAVLAIAVLLVAQRFLFRRTRRRVNPGLAAATVLTAVAMAWLGIALAITANDADDSVRTRADLVAPLAEARNIAREADGDEARMLIFPRLDDLSRLSTNLAEIEQLIDDARGSAAPGPEQRRIGQAAIALRSWRDHDQPLLDPPSPPRTHREIAALITFVPQDNPASYAEQLDEHLTAAINQYADQATAATVSARQAVANLDVLVAAFIVLAAAAAAAGLWPRIAEYYR